MKYRKKPLVIEAVQWFTHGDHPAVRQAVLHDVAVFQQPVEKLSPCGVIGTLENPQHLVSPGDWIITGVKGEHYACKPDIFAMTYEPAEAAVFQIDQCARPRTAGEALGNHWAMKTPGLDEVYTRITWFKQTNNSDMVYFLTRVLAALLELGELKNAEPAERATSSFSPARQDDL